MSTLSSVYAVILAGGQSSRLFPFNKVLSDLTGSGKSLIQQAKSRLSLLKRDQIYVLTTREMTSPIRRQLGLPAHHFFSDPVRRGTWPALLWAMAHLRQKDSQAVMAVVTGDHVIPRVKEFQKAFTQAVETASHNSAFVVIPVKPSKNPVEWLGFGAVQASFGRGRASLIENFEEKPTLERAREMITEGNWAWNAGMFFFKISTAEEALAIHHPAMYSVYQKMFEALAKKKSKQAAQSFELFPEKITHPFDTARQVDNSIDYAMMTPIVDRQRLAPRNFSVTGWATGQALTQWADLGQWTALRQLVKPDAMRNVVIGRVRRDSSTSNCILVSDKKCSVQVEGLKDYVVAFSGHEALILPEKEIPYVKEWVKRIRAQGGSMVCAGIDESRVRMSRGRLVVAGKRGFIR